MPTARGPFDVTIEAEPPFLEQDGIKLNRNMVRKQFRGDMVGRSEAQMVAAYTATPGSAGYVSIDHFTGSVGGRSGSFIPPGPWFDRKRRCRADGDDSSGLRHR